MTGVPPAPNANGAVASLVLGVLSLVVCPLCGPIAWSLGHNAEREVDASGGTLSGRGIATAGKILGIVATVLLAAIVLFFVIGILIFGIALEGFFDGTFDDTPIDTVPE